LLRKSGSVPTIGSATQNQALAFAVTFASQKWPLRGFSKAKVQTYFRLLLCSKSKAKSKSKQSKSTNFRPLLRSKSERKLPSTGAVLTKAEILFWRGGCFCSLLLRKSVQKQGYTKINFRNEE
jgi:hypothetical protein